MKLPCVLILFSAVSDRRGSCHVICMKNKLEASLYNFCLKTGRRLPFKNLGSGRYKERLKTSDHFLF